MARRTLALLAGLLALVFFGSVICPPVRERDAPPAETVGVADTLPRDGSGDGRGAGSLPEEAVLRVPVHDERGEAVEGAAVELRLPGDPPLLARATVRDGVATFLPPRAGDYLLSARAEGHLPVEDVVLRWPLEAAADAGTGAKSVPPPLVLARGATVEGRVQDLAGAPLVHGEVLLRRDDGEERVLRAHGAGAFSSGALPPGRWTVAWRRHPHAEIDPRLRHEAELAAGATLRLEFTLESGEASPTGPQVGVREVQP